MERRVLAVALPLLLAVAAAASPLPSSTTPSSPTPSSPGSSSANAVGEDPLKTLAPAVLKVLRECLSKEYSASACWKLFIVRRVDGFIGDLRSSESAQSSQDGVELLPGFVALERDARRQDNEVLDEDEDGPEAKDDGQELELDPGRDQESLDRALLSRTTRLFSGRHVSVRVLPGVALKVSPRLAKDQGSVDADVSVEVGPGFSVGRMKMKNMSPIFLLPPLMFMGVMPFMLATIKGMVIKAMMLNQMAFMSTLWMTVRDVVFGPRPIVKYYNHGYKPPRPPVHFRHPPPPKHVEHHVEHVHHSEPEHFEHHHEEHHLPDHTVEHHVEHHETHGASPFFHDESSGSAEDSSFNSAFLPQDYSQDISYGGGDDHHTAHSKQGEAGEDEEGEEGAVPLPHASPYHRRPVRPIMQHQFEARPNRLRYARAGPAPAPRPRPRPRYCPRSPTTRQLG